VEHKQKIEKWIELHNMRIKNIAAEKDGELHPQVTLLLFKENEYYVHAEIVDEGFMESDIGKQVLVRTVIPSILVGFMNNGYEVAGYNFTCGAYIRVTPNTGVVPDNWREIPKRDGIMSTTETLDGSSYHFAWYVNKENGVVSFEGVAGCETIEDAKRDGVDSLFAGCLEIAKKLLNQK
jgi:hypothetical protein